MSSTPSAPQFTLADFSYELPAELIAQTPTAERTASRLLHVNGAALVDLQFRDLPGLVAPGDLLVFNDTRVINARLTGRKPTGEPFCWRVPRTMKMDSRSGVR